MEEILGKSEPVKAEVGNLCHLFFFTWGQRVAGELPGQWALAELNAWR